MSKILARLRRRAGADRLARAGLWIDRLRGAWRLPPGVRRRLREGATSLVSGGLIETPNKSILIVSHDLGASGAPKLMSEVARACVAAGWKTIVLAPERGFYERLAAEGVTIVIHPDALNIYSPAITLASEVDLIVCNTIACDTLADYLPAEKVVWFLHETGAIDSIRNVRPASLERVHQVRDVWASSRLIADRVSIERPNCFVIGAAVDPVLSPRPNGTSGIIKVAVLGGLEIRKGQDLAIDAYRALPPAMQADVLLDLYGKIVDKDFERGVRSSIDGATNITYRGGLDPEAAVQVVAAADVIFIPSRDEPLSLVAIEGLSAGKVVVCSTAVGISSSITDGETGYIASEASVEALSATLMRALSERSTWPMIGSRASLLYASQYTPEVFGKAVKTRIAHLLGEPDDPEPADMDEWSDPDLYFAYTGR